MIQTLILKDFKTDGAVQPEEDDVRPRRPAPLHYALGILGTSKSKQTARSNSGNPRLPHLEAELSFTSFDIHSAPTTSHSRAAGRGGIRPGRANSCGQTVLRA